MEQYLKGNNMAPIKNHNDGYAHAQISSTYNSNLNLTKFLRAFMGQFFKGKFFGIIKKHNGS